MEVEKLYFVKTVTACFLTTNVDEFVDGCKGGATVTIVKEIDLDCLDQRNWIEIYNTYSK